MSVYNKDNAIWFDRSLKSIWDDQSLKPDEIILVEDGPLTEDILSVIKTWKERLGERLVLVINSENLGLTKSINKGLMVASSKYIARMDSDDISCPERLKKQFVFLEEHPQIAVLGGVVEKIDALEHTIMIRHFPIEHKDIVRYIYKASPLPHPAVMMRKTIFTNGLKYDEKYNRNQDIALWFNVLSNGYKISNLSDVILKYRITGNVYKRRSETSFNELKIYMRGIFRLNGFFSIQYIYPIARFIFRCLPDCFIRRLYNSKTYSAFLQ